MNALHKALIDLHHLEPLHKGSSVRELGQVERSTTETQVVASAAHSSPEETIDSKQDEVTDTGEGPASEVVSAAVPIKMASDTVHTAKESATDELDLWATFGFQCGAVACPGICTPFACLG